MKETPVFEKSDIEILQDKNDSMSRLLKESLQLLQIISVKSGPMRHEAYALCQKIKNFEN